MTTMSRQFLAHRGKHRVGVRAMKRAANKEGKKLREYAREQAMDRASQFHAVAKDWLRNKKCGHYHPTKRGPGRT